MPGVGVLGARTLKHFLQTTLVAKEEKRMSFLAASSAGIHPAVKAETPGAPLPPLPASGNVLFPQRFLPESSHK